jgi:acyl carrier protein
MDKKAFINEVCDILEEENVSMDAKLTSLIGWDSLARLSLIILIKDNFGLKLTINDFSDQTSLSDIIEKIGI